MIGSIQKIYFTQFSKNRQYYKKLYRLLGYCPKKIKLYQQAFLHNSTSRKLQGIDIKNNNERLEYLGDAVLDLAIAHILFNQYNSSIDQKNNVELKIDFLYEKPLKESRDLFETMYLKHHLSQNKSITDLSKKTGIERTHLYRKLKQLGIKV